MNQIVLPIDFQSMLALVASQAFIGVLLSWLIEHLSFIQDAKVANWKKLTFAVLVCVLWALISTLIQQGGLPTTANGWYMLLMVAMAVIFTNQSAYKLIESIPDLSGFLLAIFSRPALIGTAVGVGGTSVKTSVEVEQSPASQTATPTVEPGLIG